MKYTTLFHFTIYFIFILKYFINTRKFRKNMNLTQEEVGILNIRPDGPVPDDEFEDIKKEAPDPKNPIALVTFSESLKNKPVGKFRIWGTGVNMAFPTDVLENKYVKKIQEKAYNKTINEKIRIQKQKSIIKSTNKVFDMNEYQKILESESDEDSLPEEEGHTPKNSYKKNLLNLQIEREQEIYNKILKNEQSETFDKRYNGAVYNPLMSYNMQNARDYNSNGYFIKKFLNG